MWHVSGLHEAWDARELTRLELVGLASEVVTQATRIQETLRATSAPEAHDILERAQELATRAWAVLEPYATVHYFSHEVLLHVQMDLKRDQREMLKLRESADQLARAGHPGDGLIWKSLHAALGVR
jgi:hypothetical protein